jgi:hypothetical protein
MICESKIAVTKKLAQRFQRNDFFAHKCPKSRHYLAIPSTIVAGAVGATISARYARGFFPVEPLPPNLPALAPSARPDSENRGR